MLPLGIKFSFLCSITVAAVTMLPVNVYADSNQVSNTIEKRFPCPTGFTRSPIPEGTFGYYLRNLPLKPGGSNVKYFNGSVKQKDVHEAVIDMDVGTKDLQQCADAVMRLRAEYLWSTNQKDKIQFDVSHKFPAVYSRWKSGDRIQFKNNKPYWYSIGKPSDSYETFRKYMDFVFAYAGTESLANELKMTSLDKLKIGDVFIVGGSPGHCVIVIDTAINPATNEKVFMIAQSYMPAQDIHVLKNPSSLKLSPWYSVNFGDALVTPEWTFNKNNLKTF